MSLNQVATTDQFQPALGARSIWNWVQDQTVILIGLIGLAAVYLLTMAPTVFTLDSAEFAAAAYTLGIVHSPGYVVYLLLANGMTGLPVGDVAYRVNLLSAIFAMLTYITLADLIRSITKSAVVGAAGGLTLGLSYYFWSVSVIAEVYTMQAWLFALMIALTLAWGRTGSPHKLYGLALVAGLTAANNPITILWWPGIAWALFKHRDRLSGLQLGISIGFGLLGLLPLIYLPIRSAADPLFNNVGRYDATGQFVAVDLTTFAGMRWYLTGQQFDSFFFAYRPTGILVEFGTFFYQLLAAFLGIGLPLGIWGIYQLWQRDGSLLTMLSLFVLPHLIFFVNYDVVDKEIMFYPIYLVWVILMAVGFKSLIDPTRVPVWVVYLFPLLLLALNYSYADASDATLFAEDGQQRLALAQPDSLIFARWGEAAVLTYYQIVDQERPDLQVINGPHISQVDRLKIVQNALAEGRTVYATHADEKLLTHFELTPHEIGYVVSTR